MIDPTAAVAPNRIELGLDQALNAEERNLVGQGIISGDNWWLPVMKKWDSANFTWQRWVLNYDTEKQKKIFLNAGSAAAIGNPLLKVSVL